MLYGDFRAVRDMTLPIRKNEITALIGPSGCGKTTFLRCLNRMNDPIAGARVEGMLLYHGIDLYDEPTSTRRAAAAGRHGLPEAEPVPEVDLRQRRLRPEGRRLEGQRRRSRRECLQGAALWDEVKDKLKDSAMALSGGQQQRLCIARAIATSPT